MKLLRKFFNLSDQKRRCLCLMLLILYGVRLGLWKIPFQTLWQQLQRLSERPPKWLHLILPHPPTLAEMVWALDAASGYTLKPARCLARAFTLYLLMKWFGLTPTLQIGVAKPTAVDLSTEGKQTIEAHAWVEYNNQVILGQVTNLARFVPLPSLEQIN